MVLRGRVVERERRMGRNGESFFIMDSPCGKKWIPYWVFLVSARASGQEAGGVGVCGVGAARLPRVPCPQRVETSLCGL